MPPGATNRVRRAAARVEEGVKSRHMVRLRIKG